MSSFSIKRGDTSPALVYTLSPSVDLSGATVVFNMSARAGRATKIDRAPAAVVGSPADGVVSYEWRAGDTASSGFYFAEFEVTYADGAVETFPNYEFISIAISDDLG